MKKNLLMILFVFITTININAQNQLTGTLKVPVCGINAFDKDGNSLGSYLGSQPIDTFLTVCVNQEFCISSEETFWTNFLYSWTNAQITYDVNGVSTNPSPIPIPSQNTNNQVCFSYTVAGVYPIMINYHAVNANPPYEEFCGPFYVRVINPPDPSFTLTPNPVCPNQNVCASLDYPNPYISIHQINWHEIINDPICGNNTSTGHTITGYPNCFEYERQGKYAVTVYTESPCGADSTTDTIVVSLQPDFTSSGNCTGQPVNFTYSSNCSSSDIGSWYWNFGDGTTSTDQNPTHVFNSATTYNVTLTLYDNFPDCPGSSSVTIPVTILASPDRPDITGSNTTCDPASYYTIINPEGHGSYSYSYNGDGATISTNPFLVNFESNTSGNLIVTYTAQNGCTSSDTLFINACCNPANHPMFYDTTFSVNPNFSANSTVYLNGIIKFNLTTAVTISNVKFRMGPDAKIILMNSTQLTFNYSSFMQGCEEMWDGIYIQQSTSKLTFNHDTLMDAINGVYSDNGGNIDLNTSLFKNNYICTQIKRYGQSTGVNHPAHIAECYFYGALSTGSPYFLQYPPLTGKRSYAGIIVRDVGLYNTQYGVTIGDSINGTSTKRNYFRKLSYGIIDTNSNVRVINNVFGSFYAPYVGSDNSMIYPTAIEAYSKKLSQLYQPMPKYTLNVGGNSTSKINSIDSCFKGIHIARNMNLNASFNTIKNGFAGIHYESNWQANTVNIYFNVISKCAYGIVSILNNKCTSKIVRNRINCNNGIYAIGLNKSNVNESIFVDHDSITSYNCITYKNLYSPVSRCDTLKIRTFSSSPSAGMFIEGCWLHQSQNLKIFGTSTSRSYGAYIVNSGDFRFISTYINNVDTAMQFVGDNQTYTEYSLMRNSFNNSDVGLTLFYNGNIGPLGNPSKPILIQWNNVSVRNWSIDSPGANQIIYYHGAGTSSDPSTNPNNKTGTAFSCSAFTSLNIAGTTNKSPVSCPSYSLGSLSMDADITDSVDVKPEETDNYSPMAPLTYYTPLTYMAEMTKGTFDFPMYNDNAKYIEKTNAYAAICGDTAYFFTNTDLQTFKRQNDTSNIGKQYRVIKYANSDAYTTAESLNNSVSPRNVIEKLNKGLYGILISYLSNDTLTVENIDSLRVYAYYCPLEYGSSVYNARALLAKVDSLGSTYMSSCEGSIKLKNMTTGNNDNNSEQENILNNIGNENIKVYPNPAKDLLIVEFKLLDDVGEKHFELFDILGNKLKSIPIYGNDGSISISVSDLKEGMYLYRFLSSDKIISYNKLVIIK